MDLVQGIRAPCQSNLDGTTSYLFLTLINTLMRAQCTLGSKEPYPEDYGPRLLDKEQFDFIIVGGGSAGSVVANRLTENPKWRILVLEAGGYPSATSEVPSLLFNVEGSDEDWQYKTEKSENLFRAYKNGQCKWPRGKALGGSSTINAMIYYRGNSRDYDDWEKEGNPGWNYNDLEKRFRKIENLHTSTKSEIYGREGFLKLSWYDNKEPITDIITEGAQELGYQPSLVADPKNPLGYYQSIMTINLGTRMNAAKAFIGPIKDRKNLHIAMNAHVTKLILDKTSLAASGVEVQIGDRKLNIFAKKEIVLSAGSLSTPQILMHSGIGPKSHLEKVGIQVVKDLSGIGQNLQDHVIVPVFFKIDDSAILQEPYGSNLDALYKYFVYREGPMATIHASNLIGFINTKNDSKYPNIQFQHVVYRKADQYLLPLASSYFGFKEDLHKELIKINQDSALLQVMAVLLQPQSRGHIELKSNNVMEKPRFYSGYFSDERGEDMKTSIEGIRFVQKLMKTASLQKHNPELVKLTLNECDSIQYDSDTYWQCYLEHLASTIYHQVGTAKMGPKDDEMAVVDERLRVYGIENLRIVDGSIMPKITSGNTNAPCLVIGDKGGEMILEDWKNRHDEL